MAFWTNRVRQYNSRNKPGLIKNIIISIRFLKFPEGECYNMRTRAEHSGSRTAAAKLKRREDRYSFNHAKKQIFRRNDM